MGDEGRAEYVRYKLEQVRETWQEAECLYSAGNSGAVTITQARPVAPQAVAAVVPIINAYPAVLIGLLALLLVAITTSACTGDQPGLYRLTLVVGGYHTFMQGEEVAGDLIVCGGRVAVYEGTRVTGALVVLSGNVVVDGIVDGDVTLLNGTLTLGPRAYIGGDVDVGAGVLTCASQAHVEGRVNLGKVAGIPGLPGRGVVPVPAARVVRTVLGALLFAAAAYAVTLLLPRPIERIARAAAGCPAASIALGLLTGIVVPSLLVLLVFTVILAPVAFLGAVLLTGFGSLTPLS